MPRVPGPISNLARWRIQGVKLNLDAYRRCESIDWLAHCATRHQPFAVPVRQVKGRTAALRSMFSTDWANANNEACGCLTEYLSGIDYYSYGTQWNNLGKESQRALKAKLPLP